MLSGKTCHSNFLVCQTNGLKVFQSLLNNILLELLVLFSIFNSKLITEQECSAKFTQECKDCRVMEGQKAKFEATWTGNPLPEIVWELDGNPLENNKDMQIKNKDHKTSLTIFEGKVENNGYYTCRVKNELGSDRTRALLTVSSKYNQIKLVHTICRYSILWACHSFLRFDCPNFK